MCYNPENFYGHHGLRFHTFVQVYFYCLYRQRHRKSGSPDLHCWLVNPFLLVRKRREMLIPQKSYYLRRPALHAQYQQRQPRLFRFYNLFFAQKPNQLCTLLRCRRHRRQL